jgi:phage protein D
VGLNPTFRVLADSADVTAGIKDRLVSMRVTDEAGISSDVLEITLADHDPMAPLSIPRTGAELEAFMGYDGLAQRMGLFVADEIELEGWPAVMTIRARAAPYADSKGGKKGLQSQKSRSWPKDTKLADLVAKIAKENGLEPVVSKSLQAIVLPHLDQTEESDLSFLVRVAKRYDAVAKPAGGKLLVAKRGESKTASGVELSPVLLTADQCTSWRMTLARRDSPGTVLAYWHNKRAAKRQEVKVGSGEPTKSLRHWFPNADAAKAAAQAELDKRKRGEERLSVTMPGDPSLIAESPLILAGFRAGVDGLWLTTRVTHELTKSGGYTCSVECERPNE